MPIQACTQNLPSPSDHVGKTKRSSCFGEVYKADKIQNLLEERGGEGKDSILRISSFNFPFNFHPKKNLG